MPENMGEATVTENKTPSNNGSAGFCIWVESEVRLRHRYQLYLRLTEQESLSNAHQQPADLILETFSIPEESCPPTDTDITLLLRRWSRWHPERLKLDLRSRHYSWSIKEWTVLWRQLCPYNSKGLKLPRTNICDKNGRLSSNSLFYCQ